jgi:hypothetical protein
LKEVPKGPCYQRISMSVLMIRNYTITMNFLDDSIFLVPSLADTIVNRLRNFGSKHRLSTYFVSVVLNEPAERTRRVFSLVGVLFLAISLYAFLFYMGLDLFILCYALPDNLCRLSQSQGVFTFVTCGNGFT